MTSLMCRQMYNGTTTGTTYTRLTNGLTWLTNVRNTTVYRTQLYAHRNSNTYTCTVSKCRYMQSIWLWYQGENRIVILRNQVTIKLLKSNTQDL